VIAGVIVELKITDPGVISYLDVSVAFTHSVCKVYLNNRYYFGWVKY